MPVFDGRAWLPDDAFADGHHPCPAAAGEFTDRLAAAAGPWVRGSP